ncbi:MAG: hypothetical protein MK289_01770 [Trichodesmium sp. ALOHA_ZT_67]|nr:hypothetical protein [Trichodesmium sp. ALOHA_ZT_67]
MKSLLKLTRSCIHKSLGIIHKGLVFGKILDNRVLIGTHHKTGAVWIQVYLILLLPIMTENFMQIEATNI